MCPIFVGSEVVLYRKNIGAEFTLGFGVYRDPPQTWTLVSAEAHQIIEPWAVGRSGKKGSHHLLASRFLERPRRISDAFWFRRLKTHANNFKPSNLQFCNLSQVRNWTMVIFWNLIFIYRLYFIWEGRLKLTSTVTAQDFNFRSGFQAHA